MEFRKYQHIEKLGLIATDGLLDGFCYIFPKLDGTNCQVWNDNGEIKCGSRNRKLTADNDHFGFFKHIENNENIKNFLFENPNLRLYGEWLVRHNIKNYEDSAWRKFYVFDVYDENTNKYIAYSDYHKSLLNNGINIIPLIRSIWSPTISELQDTLKNSTFLIKDGGVGEGIIIKNYKFVNKFKNVVWGKLITDEFITARQKPPVAISNTPPPIEKKIVDEFLTKADVEKVYADICSEGAWDARFIPRLLNTIYYEFINDYMFDIVKKYKNPVIVFKKIQHYVNTFIKKELQFLFM
jgi:hypothetical protein